MRSRQKYKVARHVQTSVEEESTFYNLWSKAARLHWGIFSKSDSVSDYVCGLKAVLRVQMIEQVFLMPCSDRMVIDFVRQENNEDQAER